MASMAQLLWCKYSVLVLYGLTRITFALLLELYYFLYKTNLILSTIMEAEKASTGVAKCCHHNADLKRLYKEPSHCLSGF